MLGVLLSRRNELDDAEPLLESALVGRQRVLGETHPNTLRSLNHLSALRVAQRRFAEVLSLYEPFEGAIRQSFENGDAEHLCRHLTIRGQADLGLKDFDQAQAHLLESNEVCQSGPNTTDGEKRASIEALVNLYSDWSRVDSNPVIAGNLDRWQSNLDALKRPE